MRWADSRAPSPALTKKCGIINDSAMHLIEHGGPRESLS